MDGNDNVKAPGPCPWDFTILTTVYYTILQCSIGQGGKASKNAIQASATLSMIGITP